MRVHIWTDEKIVITRFKLKKTKSGVKVYFGKKLLTEEEWGVLEPHVTPHLLQKTSFDVYKGTNGYEYLEIKLPEKDANDLLDDDLNRSFEQGVKNTRELTKTTMERLIKVGIVFLTVIFSVGAFLLFMVMMNKGQQEFASSLSGVVQKQFNVTKVFGG